MKRMNEEEFRKKLGGEFAEAFEKNDFDHIGKIAILALDILTDCLGALSLGDDKTRSDGLKALFTDLERNTKLSMNEFWESKDDRKH